MRPLAFAILAIAAKAAQFFGGGGATSYIAGEQIVILGSTISTDPATTPKFSAGAGPPTATCSAGREFYRDSSNLRLYNCSATNVWSEIARISSGSGAPSAAACDSASEVGTLYYRTDNAAGAASLYTCASDGWTVGVGVVHVHSVADLTSGTLGVVRGGTNVTASLDDQTLVGNGTTWESKALPSCSDPTTSKLLYNTSTNAWSCGTDQAGGSGTYVLMDGNGGASTTIATATRQFIGPGTALPNSQESARQLIAPVDSTVTGIRVRFTSTQGSGGPLVCTLRVNGVDQSAIEVSLDNADGSPITKVDTTGSVGVAAGDLLSLGCFNNHSGPSATIGAFSIYGTR